MGDRRAWKLSIISRPRLFTFLAILTPGGVCNFPHGQISSEKGTVLNACNLSLSKKNSILPI